MFVVRSNSSGSSSVGGGGSVGSITAIYPSVTVSQERDNRSRYHALRETHSLRLSTTLPKRRKRAGPLAAI